jgi:hypothetical protein
LFVTALLVYALFANPVLVNPMTWSALDAAASLVETGRWQVAHTELYGDMDVALSGASLTTLIVQAGHIADPAPLAYAVKTLVSGTGLPVLFKDTLPAWAGIDTLHTTLARPDVHGRDLPGMLATAAGWRLVGNQILVGAAGAVVVGTVAAAIHRVWRREAATAQPALAR